MHAQYQPESVQCLTMILLRQQGPLTSWATTLRDAQWLKSTIWIAMPTQHISTS